MLSFKSKLNNFDNPLWLTSSRNNFFLLSEGLIFSYFPPFFSFEFYYRYLGIEDIFCIIYLPLFQKLISFFDWLFSRYLLSLYEGTYQIFSLNYPIQRISEYFQPWWIILTFILTDLFRFHTWIIIFSINLVRFWRSIFNDNFHFSVINHFIFSCFYQVFIFLVS